jgi:methyl-accepting chemotaxis protein
VKLGKQIGIGFAVVLAAMAVSAVVIYPKVARMTGIGAYGEGDVTKRLEIAGGFHHDEVGEVSRLFNIFMDKLQELLRGVVAHTHKVTTASQQLLEASQEITLNSGETAVQVDAVSRVTEQVNQNL